MKTFKLLGISAIALMAGQSGLATADWLSGRGYVGGGASYSIYDGLDDLATDRDELDERHITKNTFGYMLFGGWQLPSRYAIELSYADFGEFEIDEVIVVGANRYSANYSGGLAGKGIGMRYDWLAANNMNVYGRIGVMRWETTWDSRYAFNGQTIATGSDANTNSSDFYIGFGGQYELVKNLFLYGEGYYLDAQFDENGYQSKQRIYAVLGGLMYRFGQLPTRQGKSVGGSTEDGRKRDVTQCDPSYQDISGVACE